MAEESLDEDSLSNIPVISAESDNDMTSSKEIENEKDISIIMSDELKKQVKESKKISPFKTQMKESQNEMAKSIIKNLNKLKLLKRENKRPMNEKTKYKNGKSSLQDEKVLIDKSKLKFLHTNLHKSKSKVLYDMKAEESISNLLNKPKFSKPMFRADSFTAKEYIDSGMFRLNQIEQNQILDFNKTEEKISPQKMTESLHLLVRHLYKNKKTLDDNKLGKQNAKSTIKFTLNSFINEDSQT